MAELKQVPIGDIRPYAKNPRRNDASVDAVANSIREFGFRAPIICDADGIIIAGHTRYKAAKKLGLKTVPLIYAEDMSPQQAEAYRIADNSAGSASEWDFGALADIIPTLDYDLSDFGLDIFRTEDGVDFSNLEAMKDQEHTEEYDAFLDKFKDKHTTDDCFTPPSVYEAVRKWVLDKYGIPEDREIVRPFYPGGDYQKHPYSEGCLVLDNPPFSILKQIVKFYMANKIDFFIFGDTRTLGWYFDIANTVLTQTQIEYENGARVNTSFITNLGDYKVLVSASLAQAIEDAQPKEAAELNSYAYPDNIITAAMLARLSKYGAEFGIRYLQPVNKLDCGQEIYGGGAIVSEASAQTIREAKRQAQEAKERRMAAELNGAETVDGKILITLSERERALARALEDREARA